MSPNPCFGSRKRESKDADADTTSGPLTRRSLNGSTTPPTSSSTRTEPTIGSGLKPSLASSRSSSASPHKLSENEIEERDGTRYITLTVTRASGTYVTLVELGDPSFPTAYSATQYSPNTRVQNPGIPTGTIVGIVVGVFGGVILLVGVFYVYLLRARHLKRIRRRRRRARRASAGSSGPGPAPPPPPPEGAFPPANP